MQLFDDDPPAPGRYCAGTLPVDGYTFAVPDAVDQARAREGLIAETEAHFGEFLERYPSL